MNYIKNKSPVRIFLDDVRDPPNDGKFWIVCRSAHQAISVIHRYIKSGYNVCASLDHDLGEDSATGYDVLNVIEEFLVFKKEFGKDKELGKIEFLIHSANPVDRDNMARAIRSIHELQQG